ncbi:TraR/DksA C4-type zinc finger protein [Streptosporangium soli]|nr:TraR/DksA C4-type zinc finger protein [Streptosporangium sp. KLBMP 9127]
MSNVQIEAIREQLEEQLGWRTRQLDELNEALDEHAAEDGDVRLTLIADIASAERHRTSVQAALRRIDEGGYGRCGDCAAEIPFERLKIRPLAGFCMKCQQRHEVR